MVISDLIKYMVEQQPALLAVTLVLLASLPTDFSNNTLKAVITVKYLVPYRVNEVNA